MMRALFAALALASVAPAAASSAPPVERNDYANAGFSAAVSSGLRAFYRREFKEAERAFERALTAVPDNTFALSFLTAAQAQQPGRLDVATNLAEDAAIGAPKNYVDRIRLGFAYLFQSVTGRDRTLDARDEFNAAVALQPGASAAHVGLGIMRFEERSANRAKSEFLAALRADPNNVLAREYLGQLYQTDLRDPQRGLSYVIDVPNLVPQYADIAFHIGSLLCDLHENDAALKYLQRGIDLDVEHVGEAGQHGYTLIARIEIERRQFAEATKTLNVAIASDVDTIYAKTLLQRIKAGDVPTPLPHGTTIPAEASPLAPSSPR